MISLLLFIGCFKTYIIDGQLKDTNGRPVNNAIIRVPQSEVETRSNKKGKFQLEVKYKKKLGPYIMEVIPLAHEQKSTDLDLESEKEKELEKKIILEPRKILLPYPSVNLDILNTTIEPKNEESPKEVEPTPDKEESKEATPPSEETPPSIEVAPDDTTPSSTEEKPSTTETKPASPEEESEEVEE